MSTLTNVVNQVAYLRTTREYPNDLENLIIEVSRAYEDTANAVNARTIGIFSINKPAITGESWFISKDGRQQTLRKVFTITATGSFPHNINFTDVDYFTKIYGTATNGTLWFPIPYVDPTAANQISITVDATNVNIVSGGGAPVITKGIVVLEWLVFKLKL